MSGYFVHHVAVHILTQFLNQKLQNLYSFISLVLSQI